ncbi:MAG: Response regulator receiver domain protein (CheY-like) [Candidatus Woesebacteria bacterium GW2011_GWA1_33_30]|uniref:Response regulator receiver domain protein (CheY-like) n=1 Tax=Candidatus Woesebacteria bacterium GW2011_GWA2_33_28 TaxID=1618561 RepID=A0A0G0C6W3_9BACT|nr:MAG: Response regulator receiver domain protein (CheY-like) [Candidatus Woesebacteria bacterium GW2011_GWA2_33_28]KKP47895.1 MAG: Response regulator receiver domain protein (CheY-like) [Candidatus Woesebacteria bacterium GW2011_GWA1_33_30]KKP49337.1 MAG: Winged-helix transcriptional response regulator [Microgenomates group bacterium GW2011_GWC1_33_32]KKP52048.1 MAG: Response regulator receiver domain protein (CheY-like) [Candidatus Woesebacteria bacterium GW2011_GWB1_33_38]KKP57317.1 MAG: Re
MDGSKYTSLMRLLIIEDEIRLNDIIKKGLVEGGFAVDQAYDGEEGQYLAGSESYDLIILDLMLPKINGIEICKNLRKKGNKTPIIILTAKSTTEDKITGLDSGADDYITKPFSFVELKSRVHALIRRSHQNPSPVLKVQGLILNPLSHVVTREKKQIKLTPKEFAILELLMRSEGEVTTRTKIIEHVWDYNFDVMSNIVDVLVVTLRKKINSGYENKLIKTVHGVGYII